MKALLPVWLRHYRRSDWHDDLLAGVITAILLVPQALAYALLAGLPAQVGLYASVIPPIVYALTGSSRTLAVGPVAVAAVMVAAALQGFSQGDPQLAATGALWLAFLSGLMLLAFGALRLGWLSYFISHPVLNGFSTGAAITIIATQIPALTGIRIGQHDSFVDTVAAIVTELEHSQLAVMSCAGLSMLLLWFARKHLGAQLKAMSFGSTWVMLIPRLVPLMIVVFATVFSALWHWSTHMPVVGDIPQGLPLPSLSFLQIDGWTSLLGSALLIAVIGYVESLSVARLLALRRREKINANQELIALGSTNVAAAIAGGMPVAGGFSRSMVNFDAGAKTQLAAIVTALLVAVAALTFSSILAPLPKAVLAAIVVVAVTQLIDVESLVSTWRYDKRDGASQLITLVGVLTLGIEPGLLLGAGTAIALFLHRTSDPHIALVGQVPGTEHYRNVKRHTVNTWPNLLLIRIDENLYFANSSSIESHIGEMVAEHSGVSDVVLILSGVATIDASGLELLEGLHHNLKQAGIDLHLAEVKGPVTDRLERTEFYRQLNSQHVFLSTHQAVLALSNKKSSASHSQ